MTRAAVSESEATAVAAAAAVAPSERERAGKDRIFRQREGGRRRCGIVLSIESGVVVPAAVSVLIGQSVNEEKKYVRTNIVLQAVRSG